MIRKPARNAIALMLALIILLPVAVIAESGMDQSVSFGITCSEGGQYIPVFDGIGSRTRIDLLEPDQLCALDFAKLQTTYYWYHIVYLDADGEAHAGYIKENNLQQMSAIDLIEAAKDPDKEEQIRSLSAMYEESPLFLHEPETDQGIIKTRDGTRQKYILNTNTMKFHYPDCKSVKQMKEKNKREYTGTREEIMNMGYAPCKNCNP